MSKWIFTVCIALAAGVLFASQADAARLGGGRAVGAQRSVTAPPARQQAAPAQQATKAPQAAPAPAGNRWTGILGGLALGGLLGYFFGGSGLMGVLVLAGLALLAVVAVRALMQARVARPAVAAGQGPMAGNASFSMPEADTAQPMPASARFPTGFDAEGFLRGAKVNFVKLQLANDRGDLGEIREITTPELFETLQGDVQARVGRQETDITALEARLLDVATEDGRYWVSVGFSGLERARAGATPAPFSEVWNLVKPVDGSSGWLLAGIQQMH